MGEVVNIREAHAGRFLKPARVLILDMIADLHAALADYAGGTLGKFHDALELLEAIERKPADVVALQQRIVGFLVTVDAALERIELEGTRTLAGHDWAMESIAKLDAVTKEETVNVLRLVAEMR